jgi:CheY-like chemotaxis protein
MTPYKRVLWVEDAARYGLTMFASPVLMAGGFQLNITENPSDAVRKLQEMEFDAVIIDIRLPSPGNDPEWIALHKPTDDRISTRLGRHLLYTVVGHHDAVVKRGLSIEPARIGVLTIETYPEIAQDLETLGITAYVEKVAQSPRDTLLKLILQVVAQTQPQPEGHD